MNAIKAVLFMEVVMFAGVAFFVGWASILYRVEHIDARRRAQLFLVRWGAASLVAKAGIIAYLIGSL